jgi:hypothetical protein
MGGIGFQGPLCSVILAQAGIQFEKRTTKMVSRLRPPRKVEVLAGDCSVQHRQFLHPCRSETQQRFSVRGNDWVLLSLVYIALLAAPAYAAEQTISFVSCPIYRDTDAGRKSGCWLADDRDSGKRFDIADAPIKPILGREILVEGIVAGKPDTCGGIMLNPVRVSVLPTQCPSFMLPPEQFPGRPFVLPSTTLQPTHIARTPPAPPFSNQSYTIFFALNSDFLMYQHSEVLLDAALQYIEAAKPRRIVITAYAATKPVIVSGREIVEDIGVAKARAAMIVEALTRLKVPRELIHVETRGDPAPDGELAKQGLSEASKRRATVVLEM